MMRVRQHVAPVLSRTLPSFSRGLRTAQPVSCCIRFHSSAPGGAPAGADLSTLYPTMYRVATAAHGGEGPTSPPPPGGGQSESNGGGGSTHEGGNTLGTSPFEHNTVLRQVFTAPPHKIAIQVETPGGFASKLNGDSPTFTGGVSVATYTYGDLQKDVLDLALRVIRPVSAAQRQPPATGFESSEKKSCASPFHPKLPRGDDVIDTNKVVDDGEDNVAILAAPGYEFVVSLLASWVMNKMAVPMCHTHPYEGEMTYVLEHSRARMILADTILKSTKLPEAFSNPHLQDKAATFDVAVTADVTEALLAMRELRADYFKADLEASVLPSEMAGLRRGHRNTPRTADELMKAAEDDRAAKQEEELARMKKVSLEEFRRQMLPGMQDKVNANKAKKHFEYIGSIPGAHELAKIVNIDRVTSKDADCLMIYTSGTTARPKGVVHTHRSISNQVEVLHSAWNWRPDDVILNVLPLHHVHGLVNITLCALTAQARVIFTPFDNAARIARRLEVGDITLFMGVPTVYSKIEKVIRNEFTPIEQVGWKARVSEAIRLMCCGSAALPIPTLDSWREVSGHTLLERYGMTEIGMALSQPLSPEYMRIPGTVGKPLPTVRAYCDPTATDDASAGPESDVGVGNVAPDDQKAGDGSVTGALMVNSPSLFNRYWNNPAATQKEVFVHPKTKEVFFNTGDTVRIQPPSSSMPSPLFSILGRSSVDIIKRSGFKLSAIEIEAEILLLKDLVAEVAVLGVPHPTMGQEVCAVIFPSMDAITKYKLVRNEDLPEEEVPQFEMPAEMQAALGDMLKSKMAHYKCPSHYILLTHPIPRNAMGKINKKALSKSLNLA